MFWTSNKQSKLEWEAHFYILQKWLSKGKALGSFVRHFGEHVLTKMSHSDLWGIMKFKMICKYNPLCLNKHVGTQKCKLSTSKKWKMAKQSIKWPTIDELLFGSIWSLKVQTKVSHISRHWWARGANIFYINTITSEVPNLHYHICMNTVSLSPIQA